MDSVAELFDQYGATVYRRCRQMLQDDEQAKDAVQEVFLRVVRKLEQFRGDSSLLTWLYRIATTTCLQQLRNQTRRQEGLRRMAGSGEGAPGPDPHNRLVVLELMDSFDQTTVKLAYLRHVDELTMDEVAEVTGISRKTAAKKLARFEKKARHRLLGGTGAGQ